MEFRFFAHLKWCSQSTNLWSGLCQPIDHHLLGRTCTWDLCPLNSDPESFNIHMLLIISYLNKSLPIEKMDRSFGFCLFSLFRWFSAFKILISYDKNKDDKGAKIKTRIGGRPQATTHQITFNLSLPVWRKWQNDTNHCSVLLCILHSSDSIIYNIFIIYKYHVFTWKPSLFEAEQSWEGRFLVKNLKLNVKS